MKVFFPLYQIESHREPWQSANIVVELAKHGIECVLEMSDAVDAVFTGSIFAVEDAAKGYAKQPFNREIRGYREFRKPIIHYCWDLYPWVVRDPNHPEKDRIRHYLQELGDCREIWVPTSPVVKRVKEFVGKDSRIVPPPVPFWEPDEPPQDFGYVVDVMRSYPGDPNTGIVKRICEELNIPCVETGASLTQAEYRKTIANARLLVSAYKEASTGSLALLEGYRLGKQVLISDSEWNGANDLFKIGEGDGVYAHTFDWDGGEECLKDWISTLFHTPNRPSWYHSGYNEWCYRMYSDAAFARNMAKRLKEIVK